MNEHHPLIVIFLSLDVVDAATKENIQNIPSYPASPYRALEGFVELEHKQKRTQQVQENMKKLKTTAAATATTTTTTASSSAVPTLVSSPINTTFNSEPIVADVQMIIPEVSIPEPSSSSDVPAPIINAISSSSSSTPKETFSAVQLRKLMLDHLLNIINNGNYEELTSLKGIAKVRAMKIFTKRNAGYVFDCMEDLDCIGMNNKNIEKFVIENLGFMLGKI